MKLKLFGKFVNIKAKINGRLELKSQNDIVNINTIYTNLQAKGIPTVNNSNIDNSKNNNNNENDNQMEKIHTLILNT